MGDDNTFTIDELADAAGMTPRNVRAYRTKGLLPPPVRQGRASSYRGTHLTRLRHIQALRDDGLPLRMIMEAAQRGDDLSPLGPLSLLTASLARQRASVDDDDGDRDQDDVVDVAALEADQEVREQTTALLQDGSPVAHLAQRLGGHGVTQSTILIILLRASRSGRALSADLSELLQKDLLKARPQELPKPLVDDTMELAMMLTRQAFADLHPAPLA